MTDCRLLTKGCACVALTVSLIASLLLVFESEASAYDPGGGLSREVVKTICGGSGSISNSFTQRYVAYKRYVRIWVPAGQSVTTEVEGSSVYRRHGGQWHAQTNIFVRHQSLTGATQGGNGGKSFSGPNYPSSQPQPDDFEWVFSRNWTNTGEGKFLYIEVETQGFLVNGHYYTATFTVSGPQVDDPACAELEDSEIFGCNHALRNPCPFQSTLADPVDVRTGNLHMPLPGLTVPGRGLGLSFDLGYNSLNASSQSSVGSGWSSTFDMSYEVRSNGWAYVTQESGATVKFLPRPNGLWHPLDRYSATLTPKASGTVTFTRNHFETFVFDQTSGRLLSWSDQFGNTTTLEYSPVTAKLETVEDSAGRTLTVSWSGNQIVSIADEYSGPGGPRTLQFSYDLYGNLVEYTDATSGVWVMTYDVNNLLLTLQKPRHSDPDHVIENHYDTSGRVVWQDDELDRRTSFEYDSPVVGSTQSTLPDGTIQIDRFVEGRREETTVGVGTAAESSVKYTYDRPTLALRSKTDNDGNVTTYTNDRFGNRTSTKDPSGRVTRWTYNSFDQIISVQTGETATPLPASTAQVVTTTSSFDPVNGRLLTITEALGTPIAATTSFTYDTVHPEDVVKVTDARSNEWELTYDFDTGDQLSATDPLGNSTEWTYNNIGWPTSMTTPNGTSTPAPGDFTTGFGYDLGARTQTTVNPLGEMTSTTFDENGNIVAVATGITASDPVGDVTTYFYTEADELAQEVFADSSSRSYEYWPNGLLKTFTNELGQAWEYDFDEVGRLVTETDPLNAVTSYGYDLAGRVQHVVQPGAGNTCIGVRVGCITQSFDEAGRVLAVEYSDVSTPDVTNISYDGLGRRVQATRGSITETWSWDARSRLTSETDANGRTLGYGYDAASNLTSIMYPGVGVPVLRDFDAANQLVSLTDFEAQETVFGYDANGNWTGTTFPLPSENVDVYTYDEADQMTSVTWLHDTTVLGAESYTHTPKGFVESVNRSGTAGATTVGYGYDERDRLTAAGANSYVYDAASNLAVGPEGLQVVNEAQQLCWTSPTAVAGVCGAPVGDATLYAHDHRGNRTIVTPPVGDVKSHQWDQTNSMMSYSMGTNTWTYGYGVDGLRTTKTDPTTLTTEFSWSTASPIPELLGVHDASGDAWLIYGPHGQAVQQVEVDGTSVWLHRDQLGSIRLGADDSGTVVATSRWDAFGRQEVSTGSRDLLLGYVGEYTDAESGYVYLRARYYDPATSTFLSTDPLASATHEPYAYASNNPINFIDPLGLAPSDGSGDAWDSIAGKAVSWIKENPGKAATIASIGFCMTAGVVVCGITSMGGFGFRTLERINKSGFEESRGAIIADAVLTFFTFSLVTAPAHYGMLRTGTQRGVHGALDSFETGIMHGASKSWEWFGRLSYGLPDMSGFVGGWLAEDC